MTRGTFDVLVPLTVHILQRDQVLDVLYAQRWCEDLLSSREAKRPPSQLGGNTSACCFGAVYPATPGRHMCPYIPATPAGVEDMIGQE